MTAEIKHLLFTAGRLTSCFVVGFCGSWQVVLAFACYIILAALEDLNRG